MRAPSHNNQTFDVNNETTRGFKKQTLKNNTLENVPTVKVLYHTKTGVHTKRDKVSQFKMEELNNDIHGSKIMLSKSMSSLPLKVLRPYNID